MYPQYDVMKMAVDFCGLPSRNPSSQSNHEKNTRQIPNGGHCIKYLTSTPQNSQGHQKQGKSEELPQAREA